MINAINLLILWKKLFALTDRSFLIRSLCIIKMLRADALTGLRSQLTQTIRLLILQKDTYWSK